MKQFNTHKLADQEKDVLALMRKSANEPAPNPRYKNDLFEKLAQKHYPKQLQKNTAPVSTGGFFAKFFQSLAIRSPLACFLIVVIVIQSGFLATYAYKSPRVTENDSLYPLKRFIEGIEYQLAFSEEEQIRKKLYFAQRRTEELKNLSKELEKNNQTLKEIQANYQDAYRQLNTLQNIDQKKAIWKDLSKETEKADEEIRIIVQTKRNIEIAPTIIAKKNSNKVPNKKKIVAVTTSENNLINEQNEEIIVQKDSPASESEEIITATTQEKEETSSQNNTVRVANIEIPPQRNLPAIIAPGGTGAVESPLPTPPPAHEITTANNEEDETAEQIIVFDPLPRDTSVSMSDDNNDANNANGAPALDPPPGGTNGSIESGEIGLADDETTQEDNDNQLQDNIEDNQEDSSEENNEESGDNNTSIGGGGEANGNADEVTSDEANGDTQDENKLSFSDIRIEQFTKDRQMVFHVFAQVHDTKGHENIENVYLDLSSLGFSLNLEMRRDTALDTNTKQFAYENIIAPKSLEPGEYTLFIIAKNKDGKISRYTYLLSVQSQSSSVGPGSNTGGTSNIAPPSGSMPGGVGGM